MPPAACNRPAASSAIDVTAPKSRGFLAESVMVSIEPFTIFRMQWLPESATRSEPFESMARPAGPESFSPVPAIVDSIPSDVTR